LSMPVCKESHCIEVKASFISAVELVAESEVKAPDQHRYGLY
jgi:hypothetical protein